LLAAMQVIFSAANAQVLVTPTGTDQLWLTTSSGVINGINTALIDYPIAQQTYGQLAACAHGATTGIPINGVEVTDLTYSVTVSVSYPAGTYDMASVPDVIIGHNINPFHDPSKEFIMAVSFVNNNTPPDIEIDYFDIVMSSPGSFSVTYNSSEYLAYLSSFNIPLGTTHMDVVAEANVQQYNLPQCDHFFVTFDASDGGTYDIFGAYGSLSAYTTTGTQDVTDTFQTSDNWQPDVAGIQLKSGLTTFDAAVFTWVTQTNERLHTMTWRPTPDVTLATDTYWPATSLYGPDYLAHPRIDANDDCNTNAGAGNSNYKVAFEQQLYLASTLDVATFDNLSSPSPVVTSAWITIGSGSSNNRMPAVAFGPIGSQYMITEVAQNAGSPSNNYIMMTPVDMATATSIALDPSSALSYFQANNTFGIAAATNTNPTNRANAVSTPCNYVTDTSLVSWADYYAGSFRIFYKRSGYDWGGTGHYYKPGQTNAATPKKEDELTLKPNPVNDIMTSNASGQYSVMNMLGQVVQHGDLYTGRHEIDVRQLAPGNYIVTLSKEGTLPVTKKFTKN